MARPRLEDEERRTRTVGVRVTEAEEEELQERAQGARLSMGAYLRRRALGMERHQALIVSHRDGQPHVHVIANRVDPESGKAAGLSRSKLKLSKWAERYEREQGK